jgi:hypothetical protein
MGKSQFPSQFSWQSTSPTIGFLPAPGPNQSVAGNSPSSGVYAGVMTGTSTIYSSILGIRQVDNIGLEIAWTAGETGPTGVLSVWMSVSGLNWIDVTSLISPNQPAASAGVSGGWLNNVPFTYMYIQYVNATGTGTLTAYAQCKANNS